MGLNNGYDFQAIRMLNELLLDAAAIYESDPSAFPGIGAFLGGEGGGPPPDLSNYYTKSEVYNKTETYAKSEVYDKTEVYTKEEVDQAIADAIAGLSTTPNFIVVRRTGETFDGPWPAERPNAAVVAALGAEPKPEWLTGTDLHWVPVD